LFKKKKKRKQQRVHVTTDFSVDLLQVWREWDLNRGKKKKNFQRRTIDAVKSSLWNKGELMTFSDKQNLREFIYLFP
jgi:hypothetical protein